MLLAISILFKADAFAQYFPTEGAMINYNSIVFEYQYIKEAKEYVVQIYEEGNNETIFTQTSETTNCYINDGIIFGKRYHWNVTAKDSTGNIIFESPDMNFETLYPEYLNEDNFGIEVFTLNSEEKAPGLAIIDHASVAFDAHGKFVWFLPAITEGNKARLRDLKMTPGGTFTYIKEPFIANECDINGNIIWNAPLEGKISGDSTEHFHHDLYKTSKGTYMVLSQKRKKKQVPDYIDPKYIKAAPGFIEEGNKFFITITYGTLIEYDKSGKMVWHWDSENYFDDKDLFFHKDTNGIINPSSHLNAFYYDEAKEIVYVSSRDFSRIIKIDKASKKILNSYGKKMPSGESKSGDGLFRFQHNPILTKNNLLAIFNNDSTDAENISSSIILLEEPKKANGEAKIKWSFSLNFDESTDGKCSRTGSVTELPNGNLLAYMGTTGRVIEVTPQKEIVWDIEVRQYKNESDWTPFVQYRANYIPVLHPVIFSVSHQLPDTLYFKKDNSLDLTLAILNEGILKDAYQISITNDAGKIIYTPQTKLIPQYQKELINLKFKPESALPGYYFIEVSSIANGLKSKRIEDIYISK